MAKVLVFDAGVPSVTYVKYACPGCKGHHHVPAARWNWNGDTERPTLSPSVRHFYQHPETKQQVTICHYFIRNGRIEYCGDCPHELKGQTVDLPDIVAHDR